MPGAAAAAGMAALPALIHCAPRWVRTEPHRTWGTVVTCPQPPPRVCRGRQEGGLRAWWLFLLLVVRFP